MVVEPFEAMEKKVEVAVKSSVELAMEKTPERFLTRKCFWFSPASRSVSARAGVMDATCKVQLGVVVPRPKLPKASRRAYSVRELPVVFLVEKVKTDFGVVVEASVRRAAILAVVVASVEEAV